MGNANALVQSDDWAALIDDAKARKCYLDMHSLPKEFLPEPPTFGAYSSKISSSRGHKSEPRYRPQDSEVEERSASSYISRYGSHRFSRPGT